MKQFGALRVASVSIVLLAVAGLLRTLTGGVSLSATTGPLRVDGGPINLSLLAFIAGLVWLVARYSSVNLRGQNRLRRFELLLAAVASSLALMVTAGNLTTLALGWTLSGLALGGLVSHSGAASAHRAARTVTTQLATSSALVWAAVAVGWWAGLSLDGSDSVSDLASNDGLVVAVLLILACIVRSALVPAHRWLPETAEAPSPVSALLHAGIVNAAGVVAVLQWPLLSAHPSVLLGLGVVGLVTVVTCTLEQRLRTDVKGRLAASTSAQMGWMALQVGVGAPAAAVLHLMGHGAWKAWHFLRAGGAVVRARRESRIRHSPTAVERFVILALAMAPVLAVTISLARSGALTSAALLTIGVGLVIAGTAGHEAAHLERTRSATRGVVALLGGAATTLYILGATAWEHSVGAGSRLSLDPSAGRTGLAMLAVGGLVALALLANRLHPQSTHPLATLASSTSLPPGARFTARAPRGAAVTRAGGAPTRSPEEVRALVESAARLVGPIWPLRATVAANPLAGLEVLPFDDAIKMAENVHGQQLRPPLQWFLDLHASQTVDDAALDAAADEEQARSGVDVRGCLGMVQTTRAIVDREPVEGPLPGTPTQGARGPKTSSHHHAHLWSARAWHQADDVAADTRGPWHLWRTSASHASYNLACGSRGASTFVRTLPADPTEAVAVLLSLSGTRDQDFDIVVQAVASAPGWFAHARWRARRSDRLDPVMELIALRLALQALGAETPGTGSARVVPAAPGTALDTDALGRVWQRALDLSTQQRLCATMSVVDTDVVGPTDSHQAPGTQGVPSGGTTPISQSVWCIDVRSERFRRHLERVGQHETFGFAGFFGVLGRVDGPDGTQFDQCPVIVAPSVQLKARGTELHLLEALTRTMTRVTSRPGAAFGVAEAGGWAAFGAALAATLVPRQWSRVTKHALGDPRRPPLSLDVRQAAAPHRELPVELRTDMAESLLRSIGLTTNFAAVVLLCGHGSTTENNAFATAYDCGACGGNAGVLNASAMAGILNDPAVRRGLASRGIDVPERTRVLAALHDTTTDEVDVWTPNPADVAAAQIVTQHLLSAGERARTERLERLPQIGRTRSGRGVWQRSADWSEPMPEWGLAGCSAIVVGPRRVTLDANLEGRVFLHSYERQQDTDGSVLAQILTAPVVVSQWISAQYWFSAVAPAHWGAGDKTTHNMVGDIGVTSGAHGDLRVGLPWQALFGQDPGAHPDSRNDPAHVPSRHLVVIDGDPALILRAVRESDTLAQLICNGWMSLVALDNGQFMVLDPALVWRPSAVRRPLDEPARTTP